MLAAALLNSLYSSPASERRPKKVKLAYHGVPTTHHCIRVSEESKAHWQHLANKHTGGNVTAMIHAAMASFSEKNVVVVASLKEAMKKKRA